VKSRAPARHRLIPKENGGAHREHARLRLVHHALRRATGCELAFSQCADRSHSRDSQPKQKNAEKQSKDCTRETVNKIEQPGFLLGSSLKQIAPMPLTSA